MSNHPPSRTYARAFDRGWRLLVVNSLPGILGGIHVANQLFFLNPDLPFEPLTLSKLAAVYAFIGGALSLLVLTPFTWGRGSRAVRVLPWAITLVLALVAITDFVLASRYSYYLPSGIQPAHDQGRALVGTSLPGLFLHRPIAHAPSSPLWLAKPPESVLPRPAVHLCHGRTARSIQALHRSCTTALGCRIRPAADPLRRRPGWRFARRAPCRSPPRAGCPSLPECSQRVSTPGQPASIPVQEEALWTTLATGPHALSTRDCQLPGLPRQPNHRGGVGASPSYRGRGPALEDFRGARAHRRDASEGGRHMGRSGAVAATNRNRRLGRLPTRCRKASAYGFSHRYFQGNFDTPMARPGELAERGVLFRVNPEEIDPALLEDLGDRVPYPFLQDLAEDLWRESLTLFMLDQQQDAQAIFVMLPGLARVSSRNFAGFADVYLSGNQREPYLGAGPAADRLLSISRPVSRHPLGARSGTQDPRGGLCLRLRSPRGLAPDARAVDRQADQRALSTGA